MYKLKILKIKKQLSNRFIHSILEWVCDNEITIPYHSVMIDDKFNLVMVTFTINNQLVTLDNDDIDFKIVRTLKV